MEIDKTTLHDLSIFGHSDDGAVFNQLDLTLTRRGHDQLQLDFNKPLKTYEEITETQAAIRFMGDNAQQWPTVISNGTLMVVESYYVSNIDMLPQNPGQAGVLAYKVSSPGDFALVKYSVIHFVDFVKGMEQFAERYASSKTPAYLQTFLDRVSALLKRSELDVLKKAQKADDLSIAVRMKLAYFFRHHYKRQIMELLGIYGRLDAWFAMAKAAQQFNMSYPEFVQSDSPVLILNNLYHSLVHQAVAYDISLQEQQNFLFLTGANMAGKSTFIKAVGIAAFLAHIGMAVPASYMRLSVFDGLLSNINVQDNVIKGQSYFYNEVHRVKDTIHKITDGRKWLILIDELFKGTNVQDAMKCSTAVIEGLLKIKGSLFIVSTHLYEIGSNFSSYPNIVYKYFETHTESGKLKFSYQLRDGISNDRIGYLILENEGVVKMLEDL